MNPTVELDFNQRSTWGVCPVCKAPHGEKCDSNQGIHLGARVDGTPNTEGAHLGRLQAAPLRVALVPVS